MSAFAVGDKVKHINEPDVEMSVVEIKEDGKIVCSWKKGEMRKMREYPPNELVKV